MLSLRGRTSEMSGSYPADVVERVEFICDCWNGRRNDRSVETGEKDAECQRGGDEVEA